MSVFTTADGVRLTYQQSQPPTSRTTLIFQHGMGGDLHQPLGYLGAGPATPVVCMNARGHGDSDSITNPEQAAFDVFADDVIALADHLGLQRFIIGGISLGAGVAINLAGRYPERVTGLILCRPAWADHPQASFNQETYAYLARLLNTMSVPDAVADFTATTTYQTVAARSPAVADSLLGQLTRPRAAENSAILTRFPTTMPTKDRRTWRALQLPTLVIGHHDDPFHPYDIAQLHRREIPNSRLITVPSKDADGQGFFHQTATALNSFLKERALA